MDHSAEIPYIGYFFTEIISKNQFYIRIILNQKFGLIL